MRERVKEKERAKRNEERKGDKDAGMRQEVMRQAEKAHWLRTDPGIENRICASYALGTKSSQQQKQLCAGYKLSVCVQGDYWQAARGQDRVHEDRNTLLQVKMGYAPTYAPHIYIYKKK